jgi:hypothetical protein
MPLQIAARKLKQILRAAGVVHTESECRIDISTDGVRLQSFRRNRTIYLDYSLPYSVTSIGDDTDSTWIKLNPITRFLNGISDGEVRVTFPFETPDSTVVIESNGLVYQFRSLIAPHGHYLPSPPDSTAVATTSIRHFPFKRAVRTANWLGGEMEIQIAPDTHRVKFTATQDGKDDFTYVVRPDDVEAIQGSATKFTIPINVVRNFTPTLPANSVITLRLTPHYLLFTVEFPDPDAELQLYIAERKHIVPA